MPGTDRGDDDVELDISESLPIPNPGISPDVQPLYNATSHPQLVCSQSGHIHKRFGSLPRSVSTRSFPASQESHSWSRDSSADAKAKRRATLNAPASRRRFPSRRVHRNSYKTRKGFAQQAFPGRQSAVASARIETWALPGSTNSTGGALRLWALLIGHNQEADR